MIYIITWSAVLLASASAVAALVWSLQTGQLQELEKGAKTIFEVDDGDEERPDTFPPARKAGTTPPAQESDSRP